MKCKNLLYALSLTLIFPSAWGCHLSEQPHNAYQKQGKGVIYIQLTEDHNLPLPEVNFKRLRRMADLSIDPTEQEEWEKEPPLTDLTTDYIYEGAQAFFPALFLP